MNREDVDLQALLSTDEERVYNTLRAAQNEDKNREKTVRLLSDEWGALLLRHNAACVDDRMRQAEADAMTAAARDSLDLLLAGRAELEKGGGRTRAGAPYLLIAAALFCAAAVYLLGTHPLAAYIGVGLAVILAFLAGRLWHKEGAARAVSCLDPDTVWRTMKKTTETMDRKLRELAELEQERQNKREAENANQPLDPQELALLCELLEALYTNNGDYALRQLGKIRTYLRQKGLELVDYSDETEELFELLPSKKGAATLRPALMHGDKLLKIGRATQPVDGPTRQ